LFNYNIYNNFLNLKNYYKYYINLNLRKNYKIYLIIKNIYIKLEFKYLINMKKRKIDLNEYLNIISYEFIDEECKLLYLDYINDIKETNNLYILKEKLFKLILKKNTSNN
jgi:hypothetical protein